MSKNLDFTKKTIKFFAVFFYLTTVFFGFYALFISKSNLRLNTPWQTIHPAYIYIFFISTFLLGIFVWQLQNFNKYFLLGIFILQTFLLHSYLPLTHELFYGSDQWRHMANEIRILNHEPYLNPQVVIHSPQSLIQKLDVGLISYFEYWYIAVFLVKLLSVNLISVNQWLLPILWSLVFPLALYQISKSLRFDSKKSLLVIWLGFLPFTWIVGGSISLPNGLGFLGWLFLFWLLVNYLEKPNQKIFLPLIFIAFLASFLGYILYAVVLAICILVAFALPRIQKINSPAYKNFARISMIFLGILVIPAMEILAGYSFWNWHHAWIFQIKQFVGNVLGVYIAFGPRPHDISTGNIIFNQVPSNSFVSNFFTDCRLTIVPFMLVFLSLVSIGIWQGLKSSLKSRHVLAALAIIFSGSYFVGRYILEGDQILSRRLEHVLAFFWIFSFLFGIEFLFSKLVFKNIIFKKVLGLTAIFIYTFAICISYSLGPDEKTLSASSFEAVQYVFEKDSQSENHCVLADTETLLALEAVSRKQIIGGGFPINQNFSQPEREEFFKKLSQNADQQTWIDALDLTKTNTCFLVVNKKDFKYNEFANQHLSDTKLFGDVVVWNYVGVSQSLKL
jgi:hypothetical protein